LLLPTELAGVDALLDDPVFFAPFAAHFDARVGRPLIAGLMRRPLPDHEPGIPLHGTAAMAAYAYDQIDQARAELNAVSKKTTFETTGS
jgi:hypothetical protein